MLIKSKTSTLSHFLTMHALDAEKITYLLNRGEYFLKEVIAKQKVLDTLRGRVIANLFFEPSTRTRNSFEIAEQRLGAIVLSPTMNQSSTVKGELLIDTLRNLQATGVALFVIRHSDNNLAQFLSAELHSGAAIINAGDGSNEHPTQALLDLMTIKQNIKHFSTLSIAIVGDVKHSRVAHSLICGLETLGTPEIRIVMPKNLMGDQFDISSNVKVFHDINAGLKDVDIVYALRTQKERMPKTEHPDDDQYFKQFGITTDRLALAKSDAIVMHPGPMNRGIEIESAVADGPQSVILQQTRNSVAIRMAIIEALLVAH